MRSVGRTVGDAFDPDVNGITVVRLALALVVVFSHAFKVGGFGGDPAEQLSGGTTQLGTVAVIAFMVLSGFLVTRSREHTRAPAFAWRRFLRIMPAYWVCLLVTVAVIVPIGAAADGTTVSPATSLEYVTGNALLLQMQPAVGDAFRGNPLSWVVNGSLWTLAPEVACYLGILFVPRRLLRVLAPGVVLALIVVHAVRMTGADPEMLAVDFPLAFAAGACAWLYRDRIPMNGGLAALAAAAATASIMAGAVVAVGIPFVAYLVLWLGITIRRPVDTDLSYGVYIYAFPLQQVAAVVGLHGLGLGPFVAISVAMALGAGALSWRLVERPVMRLKRVSAMSIGWRLWLSLASLRRGSLRSRVASPEA